MEFVKGHVLLIVIIPDCRSFVLQSTDAPLMTASEVWFLRAEAALRGWTDEDEESLLPERRNYLLFIKMGNLWVEDYLNSERMAFDFEDTYDERQQYRSAL